MQVSTALGRVAVLLVVVGMASVSGVAGLLVWGVLDLGALDGGQTLPLLVGACLPVGASVLLPIEVAARLRSCGRRGVMAGGLGSGLGATAALLSAVHSGEGVSIGWLCALNAFGAAVGTVPWVATGGRSPAPAGNDTP
jgi:hypothetical protein